MLSKAQDYELVWEENFDGTSLDASIWNIEQEEGVWNTGSNQELQHYTSDNVTVGSDEDGNNCLIITAKDEDYDGYSFTSGRINTSGKFAFRYGKIEARIKLPDLADGLWPAFWLLGNTTDVWPACGEVDIMEAGHADGIEAGTQNTLFGGALHWEYEDDYAGYGTTAESSTALNSDYHTFTMEWSDTNISMYLDDSSTAYYSMDVDGDDAEEFRDYSMYIVVNLAVGGMYPGIYDDASISAPMPAELLVDYIKVYQKEGEGELDETSALYGSLAVYADDTNCENSLDFGFDATLSSSGVSERSGESAKEGSDVLSYSLSNGSAYEVSIVSEAIKNLSALEDDGSLDVYLKTDITSDIQIGLGDDTEAESWVTLNSSSDYNCTRDGEWSRVAIPFSAFSGLDFSQLEDVFMIKGTPDVDGYISIDKVILSKSTTSFELFGIYTDNPNITAGFLIDDILGHLYIWSSTMETIDDAPTYDGDEVLAFTSSATNTWFGYSLTSDEDIDLEQFEDGYLKLALRSSDTNDFWIGVGGADSSEGRIYFYNESDPYDFERDGEWHRITIEVADLVAQGLDLSACGNIFMLGGSPYITDVLVDDVYFSVAATDADNTALNPDGNEALVESDEFTIEADYYGIYSENTNISEHFVIDDVDGHIYIWSSTLSELTGGTAYEGTEHLYFTSNSVGWYGFGILSDNALDLSHFEDGYLALSLKTSSSSDFWLGMQGAAGSEGKLTISSGSTYDFDRDGEWHRVLIPMSEFTDLGLEMYACDNIFMLGGTEISDIAIDDVILTVDATQPVNGSVVAAVYVTTGVDEVEESLVTLFPNPVSDMVNVTGVDDGSIVEIYSISGKRIKCVELIGGKIDVTELTKGVYVFKVNGSICKLIKQ